MKELILLFSFLVFFKAIRAQEKLQTIKANSAKVDIRVGDEYFAKGGWELEPSIKPDVFSIGSKWIYKTKKVTFITDIDSIAIDVKPGSRYNFIILLNQKTPCYIQIATLPNPLFMNLKIVISILLGIAIFFAWVYYNRNKISTVNLLYLGYIATTLFWLVTFISGLIHGNYNHFKNVISELGAIGTKSEIFTSSAFVFLSVVCTIFSIGFYRASKAFKLSAIPAVSSFVIPVTMLWASIFTLGNEFHSLTGPLPFLLIIGCLSAFLLWKKNKEFSKLRTLSLFSFLIMMLIFLQFTKLFGSQYSGLTQRFFYLGWTVWTISTSYYFLKKLKVLQA